VSLSNWIIDAAEEIASSPSCCDISSASAGAIADVIRKHLALVVAEVEPIDAQAMHDLITLARDALRPSK
jgi:hypothetical protein